MAPTYFMIEGGSVIPGGWGGYGDILEHGMSKHLPRQDGKLQLERTGPYISPITFPGLSDIVLTSTARADLEGSGLTGFSFQPVLKRLIVELHWEDWDLTASEPAKYPDTGEPEDYILEKPHSPETAAALGDLWELVIEKTVTVIRPGRDTNLRWPEFRKHCWIDSSTWNGADIFRSKDVGGAFFTERGRDWFLKQFGPSVSFEEYQSK
jgi:hypothetical protein